MGTGGVYVGQKIILSEEEVQNFLTELKNLLGNPDFNIGADLDILMRKRSESPIDPYTTVNTLLALDFDKYDVFKQLMSLETNEYLETIIDDRDRSLPPFYAFAKEIKSREVYIKVKIRDRQKGKVFCVSFHFARYPIPQRLPYE